jgi:hypothetical protein
MCAAARNATRTAMCAAGPQPARQASGAAVANAMRRSRPQALLAHEHKLSESQAGLVRRAENSTRRGRRVT